MLLRALGVLVCFYFRKKRFDKNKINQAGEESVHCWVCVGCCTNLYFPSDSHV